MSPPTPAWMVSHFSDGALMLTEAHVCRVTRLTYRPPQAAAPELCVDLNGTLLGTHQPQFALSCLSLLSTPGHD